MNKYRVEINVFNEKGYDTKELIIEAGNKKLATLRGLAKINDDPELKERYKSVKSVELIGGTANA